MVIFDRPHARWYEYKNNKFVVDFSWGMSDNKIPVFGRCEVVIDGVVFRRDVNPSRPWHSLDEASSDVVDQLHQFIDCRFD